MGSLEGGEFPVTRCSRTSWPLYHDPIEGTHALGGIAAYVKTPPWSGLVCSSWMAIFGGSDHIKVPWLILPSVCFLLCLLVPHQLGFHRQHIHHSLSWNPSTLSLALSLNLNPWKIQLFLSSSLLAGGWILLEKGPSDLKNVASVNVWCPASHLEVDPVTSSYPLVNFSLIYLVALHIFCAWQRSPFSLSVKASVIKCPDTSFLGYAPEAPFSISLWLHRQGVLPALSSLPSLGTEPFTPVAFEGNLFYVSTLVCLFCLSALPLIPHSLWCHWPIGSLPGSPFLLGLLNTEDSGSSFHVPYVGLSFQLNLLGSVPG